MKDIFKDLIDSTVKEALDKTASETKEKLNSTKDIINEIINSTVREYKKQNEVRAKNEKSSFSEKTYTDEPILFVASKMKNYTPPKITEMRKLEKGASWSAMSDPGIFYKQAKFMEDYEDDYEFRGEFVRYYPTYRSMSTSELRGYFSWRTKLRKGIVGKTSLSFAFVYIYELLNLIGCKDAEDGYFKLKEFFELYGDLDSRILQYRKSWLNDFVVYYGLSPSYYILDESESKEYENALIILSDHEKRTDEEIFSALTVFSSYNIIASPFYKAYPEDVRAVVAAVYRKLSLYHQKHRKTSLNEKFFGKSFKGSYFMFNAAVFCERKKHEDTVYEVNSIQKFICTNGSWYQEKTFHVKGKSQEVREILKNIDCLMREKYNFKHKLTRVDSTKIIYDIINECIDDRLKANKKPEKVQISIDVSKLQSIRDTSLITQNKLIIEEESDEEPIITINNEIKEDIKEEEKLIIKEEPKEEEEKKEDFVNETELNDTEFTFAVKLVRSEDYASFLREKGIMLSVMIDTVNEKLYDIFGDAIIDFDGDTPIIIEDYLDELKGILNI